MDVPRRQATPAPEDCGGVSGYQEFLKAIPRHPEHEAMLEWVGGSFDPEAFDLASLNGRLVGRFPGLRAPARAEKRRLRAWYT